MALNSHHEVFFVFIFNPSAPMTDRLARRHDWSIWTHPDNRYIDSFFSLGIVLTIEIYH